MLGQIYGLISGQTSEPTQEQEEKDEKQEIY